MPSSLSQHPPLSLEQQLAHLKAENARLQEERDSFSRIATSSLRTLRREMDRPSGFWIREEEEERVLELERVSDQGVTVFYGGNWRWWTVSQSFPPSLPLLPPLVLSLPSRLPRSFFSPLIRTARGCLFQPRSNLHPSRLLPSTSTFLFESRSLPRSSKPSDRSPTSPLAPNSPESTSQGSSPAALTSTRVSISVSGGSLIFSCRR